MGSTEARLLMDLLRWQEERFSPCPYCKSDSACAADCSNAPWNHDKPSTSRFIYLLRMRRWLGGPIFDRRDIFFIRNY